MVSNTTDCSNCDFKDRMMEQNLSLMEAFRAEQQKFIATVTKDVTETMNTRFSEEKKQLTDTMNTRISEEKKQLTDTMNTRFSVLEGNMKIVTKICSEPKVINTAVQIMKNCFKNNDTIHPPSRRFYAASLLPENTCILEIFTSALKCELSDIDCLIQVRNK